MLRILLAKDLRRVWRNPLPVLINLALPLCIVALVGMVFGGHSESGALGRIRFAVVDEDDSLLSHFLRGAAGQNQRGSEYLEPVFLDREAAMKQVTDNKLSAVLIIPTNFTHDYFTGAEKVSLELIKNPAQSVHPAVLEELLGAVVAGLNAISRNLQSDFPEYRQVIKHGDYHDIAALVERTGNKLKAARQYLKPPLVMYDKGEPATSNSVAATSDTEKSSASGTKSKKNNKLSATFGYLLVGMSGMFLLFLANTAMTDLHRELRLHTLARYHTLHHQLAPFIASKVVFAIILLMICSAILLGGGGWVFGVMWQHPLALAGLAAGYAAFVAGLMAVFVALIPDERRANALISVVSMCFAMLGGCLFPAQSLPAFLRHNITPLLPTNWFVNAARDLQYNADTAWVYVLVKLLVACLVLLVIAAALFRRQFGKGVRP